MLIKTSQTEFKKCLEIVEKGLPFRSTLPVLHNICLEATGDCLIFSATNLEIEVKCKMPFSGDKMAGILLPPKIADIVRYLPSKEVEIFINPENNRVDLSSNTAKFSLFSANTDEYPVIEEHFPAGEPLVLEAATLKKALRQVIFAASTDEARPAFTGIYFLFHKEGITVIASDTYRLVVEELKLATAGESGEYLIPAKSVRELLKILEEEEGRKASVFAHQKRLVFNFDPVYFATRILDEKFPDVRGVIPQKFETRVIVERKFLEDTVYRASLLAEGLNQAIQLLVKDKIMQVKVSSPVGRMEENLAVEAEGQDIEIYVNSRFILDMLKVVEFDKIYIEFNGKNGPLVFKSPEDEGYLYLVLPIKME